MKTHMIHFNSEFRAYALNCLRIKIKSAWWVRKHETQSCSESCVFSFSNPILYTALHKCVLSTL